MAVGIEKQREKIVEFRSNGLTFSEIERETGVNKGTIHRLLQGASFSQESLKKIETNRVAKMARGLTQSKLSRQIKKQFRERSALIDSKKLFDKFKKDPFFTSGVILYWAHGSSGNNYFQFTSGDSEKILFIINWLSKYQKIKPEELKYRLFCPQAGQRASLEYWESTLKPKKPIPISFVGKKASKNVENKGVLQVSLYNMTLSLKMGFWQKQFVEYYKST